MTTYCGSIGLLGQPNAGKSTLLNALLGQKLAGVSKKPQTTRNRIRGFVTEEDVQYLFMDTPGLHHAHKGRLNQLMMKEAYKALDDADVICYLIDITKSLSEADLLFLKNLREQGASLVIFLSKADKLQKARRQEILHEVQAQLAEHGGAESVFLLTAKQKESLAEFKEILKGYLPEGEFLYPADEMTDRPTRFIVCELIREALFRQLGNELPYQCAVVIDKYEEKDHVTAMMATIVVARDSQKGMVIGKGGKKIKEIGQLARGSLESLLGKQVYLDLAVRVERQWMEHKSQAASFLEAH